MVFSINLYEENKERIENPPAAADTDASGLGPFEMTAAERSVSATNMIAAEPEQNVKLQSAIMCFAAAVPAFGVVAMLTYKLRQRQSPEVDSYSFLAQA